MNPLKETIDELIIIPKTRNNSILPTHSYQCNLTLSPFHEIACEITSPILIKQ